MNSDQSIHFRHLKYPPCLWDYFPVDEGNYLFFSILISIQILIFISLKVFVITIYIFEELSQFSHKFHPI